MEEIIKSIAIPIVIAVATGWLGYMQGRWSRHKEIIFERKVTLYEDLIAKLLHFCSICSPKSKLKDADFLQALSAYTDLQNSFYAASLFMSEKLHEDIGTAFTPAHDRIASINHAINQLQKIKSGDAKSTHDLGFEDFDSFKKSLLENIRDLGQLPGPFFPIIQATPRILKMLKQDLGISQLDSKFYRGSK